MSLHVAAYDITRDSSRQTVARILSRYGRRVQDSVFEIELEQEDLKDLKREVGPWLAATDRFDIFPVDLRRASARLSWQRDPTPDSVQLF